MSDLLTTELWLSKAVEVRLIAGKLRDEMARRIMLSIAVGYERLAEHASSLAVRELSVDEGSPIFPTDPTQVTPPIIPRVSARRQG